MVLNRYQERRLATMSMMLCSHRHRSREGSARGIRLLGLCFSLNKVSRFPEASDVFIVIYIVYVYNYNDTPGRARAVRVRPRLLFISALLFFCVRQRAELDIERAAVSRRRPGTELAV